MLILMKYFTLEPEVAGGFGPNSILNTSVRPPSVTKFHYEFDVWLGDPLLEAVGCFIATEALKERIQAMNATGVSFSTVEVSKSIQFKDLYPNCQLPKFVWLQVTGRPGIDDFGLSSKHSLVVSEKIRNALKAAGMSHADISDYK